MSKMTDTDAAILENFDALSTAIVARVEDQCSSIRHAIPDSYLFIVTLSAARIIDQHITSAAFTRSIARRAECIAARSALKVGARASASVVNRAFTSPHYALDEYSAQETVHVYTRAAAELRDDLVEFVTHPSVQAYPHPHFLIKICMMCSAECSRMHSIGKTIIRRACTSCKQWCNPTWIHACATCGRMSTTLLQCGGCERTYYCSHECQRAQWATHKRICT